MSQLISDYSRHHFPLFFYIFQALGFSFLKIISIEKTHLINLYLISIIKSNFLLAKQFQIQSFFEMIMFHFKISFLEQDDFLNFVLIFFTMIHFLSLSRQQTIDFFLFHHLIPKFCKLGSSVHFEYFLVSYSCYLIHHLILEFCLFGFSIIFEYFLIHYFYFPN